MNIKEIRAAADVFTEKLSDLCHQLSFAGIAIVWIFRIKSPDAGGVVYPGSLVYPITFFVLSLLFALLQYAYASYKWTKIGDKLDNEGIEDDEISNCVNKPTTILFILKVTFVFLGYVEICRNLMQVF